MLDAFEDDDEWLKTDDDSDEEEEGVDEIGDLLSVTSSVPTTRNSITDEQTAASVLRQKEAQRIFSSTLVLIGMFIIAVVISSVAVSGFATQQENEVFEDQVSDRAYELIISLGILRDGIFHQTQLDHGGVDGKMYAFPNSLRFSV